MPRNPIKELMSARNRGASIAEEDDSIAAADWPISLLLQIKIDEADRLSAYWQKVADEGRAALEKLGAPEPDDDAKHRKFMQYVESVDE